MSSKSSKSLWSDLGNSSFGNLSLSASRCIPLSFTVFYTLNSKLILLFSSNYEAGTLERVVLLSLVFLSVSSFLLLSILYVPIYVVDHELMSRSTSILLTSRRFTSEEDLCPRIDYHQLSGEVSY